MSVVKEATKPDGLNLVLELISEVRPAVLLVRV